MREDGGAVEIVTFCHGLKMTAADRMCGLAILGAEKEARTTRRGGSSIVVIGLVNCGVIH